MGTCSGVGKLSACSQIVLETIHQHRTHFHSVGIAVDTFHNEELVVILTRLREANTHAGDPLPFGDKRHLLEFALEFNLRVCHTAGRDHSHSQE